MTALKLVRFYMARKKWERTNCYLFSKIMFGFKQEQPTVTPYKQVKTADVVHTCNPGYSGSWGRRFMNLRSVWAKRERGSKGEGEEEHASALNPPLIPVLGPLHKTISQLHPIPFSFFWDKVFLCIPHRPWSQQPSCPSLLWVLRSKASTTMPGSFFSPTLVTPYMKRQTELRVLPVYPWLSTITRKLIAW